MTKLPGVTRVCDVISVHQSPMNPKRWCLGLSCGHDQWVTATRRPQSRTAKCHESHEAAAQQEQK